MTVQSRQRIAQARIQAQRLQRMETLQGMPDIGKPAEHLGRLDAPGAIPGLRPLVHDHDLVELEIVIARRVVRDGGRQEDRLGIGIRLLAALDFQAPPAQAVHEHLQHVHHLIERHAGRARLVLVRETLHVLECRHRRVQALRVVDIHARQQPGLDPGHIHQAQRRADMRDEVQRHAGTGASHHAHPVQHEILLVAREAGQCPRRFLGRAQRDHVDIEPLLQLRGGQRQAAGLQELGGVVPARSDAGRQHAPVRGLHTKMQRLDRAAGQHLAQQLAQALGLPGDRPAVSRQPHAERVLRQQPGQVLHQLRHVDLAVPHLPARPVTDGRDRQDHHLEPPLAAQQMLDVVHHVVVHVLDVARAGMHARQGQHVGTGIDMHHGGAGLQRQCGDEAVAPEQVEHVDLVEVIATLDALAYPLRAGDVTAAQADMAARIRPAQHILVADPGRPLARQAVVLRLPVPLHAEIGDIDPVRAPLAVGGQAGRLPVRAVHPVVSPALQLAPAAEVDEFIVIDRRRGDGIAGVGLGNGGELNHDSGCYQINSESG